MSGGDKMKTLIAYATKHGCTEKSAEILAKELVGEADLCNLGRVSNVNLQQYDKIIIGSSVYMGKIRKEARAFCSSHSNKLKESKIGLFICCMKEGSEAESELKNSFPQELYENAVTTEIFGGGFNFDKMNFMEKMVVKKVVGIKQSKSNILETNIKKLAAKMSKA
jgi:menaquinone-dependent protoporphyrinogen oxidase